jgi:hypothetical protein
MVHRQLFSSRTCCEARDRYDEASGPTWLRRDPRPLALTTHVPFFLSFFLLCYEDLLDPDMETLLVGYWTAATRWCVRVL